MPRSLSTAGSQHVCPRRVRQRPELRLLASKGTRGSRPAHLPRVDAQALPAASSKGFARLILGF
ncbi:MAG: hypothetical protein ABIZ80_16440, partial [Bryobacteraceae bacterium]